MFAATRGVSALLASSSLSSSSRFVGAGARNAVLRERGRPPTSRLTTSQSSGDETWGSRLRRLAMTYGPLAIGFHLSVEAVVLGGFYFALGNGLLDVSVCLDKFESVTGIKIPISPTASRALGAYVLTTSLTGFPRTVLTVVATPWLARKLGYRGYQAVKR